MTLYGLFENAIYGGRVDNDQDLRVLGAYLQSYFNPDRLKVGGTPLPIGALPTTKDMKDYMSLINKIPESDTP